MLNQRLLDWMCVALFAICTLLASYAVLTSNGNENEESDKCAQSDAQCQNNNTKDVNDRHIAEGTLALVIVTVFVGVIQTYFLVRADSKAQRVSEIARITAQATLDANRPWLNFGVQIGSGFRDNGRDGARIVCIITIRNVWTSPAPWTNISATIDHSVHIPDCTIAGIRGPAIFPNDAPIILNSWAVVHDLVTKNQWGRSNVQLRVVIKYGTNGPVDGTIKKHWNIRSDSARGIDLNDFSHHQGYDLDHIPEEDYAS